MKTIVVAVNQDGVMGKDNTLPWHNPEDLKHFKNYTMGKDTIMGRKTFESIGRLLPGRRNIIITRDEDYEVDGAVVVHNIHEALKAAKSEEVIIGGGANIYEQFLEEDLVDEIVMSFIETETIEGGVTFPKFREEDWKIIEEIGYNTFNVKIFERLR